MADQRTPPRPGRAALAGPTPPAGRRPPRATRERRPALAALAVLLIVGGALGAAYLVVQSGHRVEAIEVVRPIGAGERIPAAALGPVRIAAGRGLRYVPWNEAGLLARYYAATAIPPGTLLSSAMVAGASDLASGRDVVGLALKDGQLPDNLEVGDHVAVFQVANAAQSCPGAPGAVLAADATVLGVSAPPVDSGSGATDVEVALAPADAGAVACSAANGTVGVARLPAGGAPSPGRAAGRGARRRPHRPGTPGPTPRSSASPGPAGASASPGPAGASASPGPAG